VADAARAQGLVFATASIPPQPLTDGVLHVALDEGRVDAVRSLGRPNPAVDRVLATLVTHRGVTRAELERAVLLAGDVAGVRIKTTRYLRENGFGILLVTVEESRITAYASVDNRGTREIGPIRGVGLVSLRGRSGDEIGLVVADTPTQPSEFEFVSARYAAPLGPAGGVASASAFYGHTRAGGRLSALDLTGESYGVTAGYSLPIRRSRRQSLWFDVEFRALRSTQQVAAYRFRDDALDVLSGTLRDVSTVAGGTLHVAIQGSTGLPLPGVTHAGDPLASRTDGDARYVAGSLVADWSRAVAGPVSIALASAAQVASRALLASAQASLGGPAFARGYDYSERTGDDGVMGSAELRIDMPRLSPLFGRFQLYAFGDGGTVEMIGFGGTRGGGSLASGGGGLRLGRGPMDAGLEVAVPFTGPRFDAGNRSPRLSGQLALHF
jgi:hemolysin activation/secretion protein